MDNRHITHEVKQMHAAGSLETIEKRLPTARDYAITSAVLSIVVALLVSAVGYLVVSHRDAEFIEHCTSNGNGYGLVLSAGDAIPGGYGGADLTVTERTRVCLGLPGGYAAG